MVIMEETSSPAASSEDTYIKEEDLTDIEICLNEVVNEINEESKNTNKATDVSWRIFAHFLAEKFPETNIETIPKFELNDILSKFYVEVRKKNGSMYTKSSMNSIRFGIQRKFKQMRANFDIIEDPEFSSSSEMFKAQCIHLKRQGLAKVEHKPSIKRSDMIKLYTSPVLSHDQPKSLQRKVFLDIMLFLCKRGQENFRELKKTNFVLKKDLHGLEYVEKVLDSLSPTNSGDDNSDDGGIMAATSTKICPVYSFKLYMSRLDPDTDVFFQRPKPFAPPSGPWYHPLMLGKHCFGKMMKGISKDANLSFNYTNHCIRATSVSVLDDAGLEARHIMAVSGHKSESSIRTYARSGIGTKRKMSDALAFYVNPENENKMLEHGPENGSEGVVVYMEPVLQPVGYNRDSRDGSREISRENSRDIVRDMPRDMSREMGREMVRDLSRDMPRDMPRDMSREMTRDAIRERESPVHNNNTDVREGDPTRKRSPVDQDSSDDSEEEAKLLDNDPSEIEMASLINTFGADVSKSLHSKRKRFQQFTATSIKASSSKYEDVFTQQDSERERVLDEYGKELNDIFSAWELDLQKSREANEELENMVKQLQRSLHHQQMVQSERLKSLKSLHEHYINTSKDLAKMHKDQHVNIHAELRKELSSLQKKMMEDARQDEISSVRKSLQTMLSQV